MNEKAIPMAEEEKIKVKKTNKREKKHKGKKPKEKRKFKFNAKKFFGVIWFGVLVFLKVIWKIIKFFLKYVLFPFWYTGVLFVKTFKFLKTRGKGPLTEEDKKYLSLIPTLFFMMAICIIIVYLIFYLDSIYDFLAATKILLESQSFWAAVGQWFVDFFVGIYYGILLPIGIFIKYKVIYGFADLINQGQWVAAFILLAILVVGTGLIILIVNLARKGKIFKVIKNFFIKIKNGIAKGHEAVRRFVLKYLIGEKYIKTRSKNFFWTNVFLQLLVTLFFLVFSIYLIVKYYMIDGLWAQIDIMRYASFAAALLFAGVGIFATWFFSIVHGVSTSPMKEESK